MQSFSPHTHSHTEGTPVVGTLVGSSEIGKQRFMNNRNNGNHMRDILMISQAELYALYHSLCLKSLSLISRALIWRMKWETIFLLQRNAESNPQRNSARFNDFRHCRIWIVCELRRTFFSLLFSIFNEIYHQNSTRFCTLLLHILNAFHFSILLASFCVGCLFYCYCYCYCHLLFAVQSMLSLCYSFIQLS